MDKDVALLNDRLDGLESHDLKALMNFTGRRIKGKETMEHRHEDVLWRYRAQSRNGLCLTLLRVKRSPWCRRIREVQGIKTSLHDKPLCTMSPGSPIATRNSRTLSKAQVLDVQQENQIRPGFSTNTGD